MHLVLAHDHGLGPEALDDGAHMRADRRRGDEHGQFAHLGGVLKTLLDGDDELLQAAWRHGEVPLGAIAGTRLLPKITYRSVQNVVSALLVLIAAGLIGGII